VVERPGPDKGAGELFFRGQLHPLSVTLLDNGAQLWGEVNYKVDFYLEPTIERLSKVLEGVLRAVASQPELRLGQIGERVDEAPGTAVSHRPVGSWRLEEG